MSRAVVNPTFDPVAKAGAMHDYFRGNPDGKQPDVEGLAGKVFYVWFDALGNYIPALGYADEQAQIAAAQAGFINFYDEDAVNPYVAVAARGPSRRGRSSARRAHERICPLPWITYLYVVSSRRPIGPRACNFCVEIPISAPKPNSPPSVNRVDALTITATDAATMRQW